MSRCCGDWGLCQTWVTWICRQRSLSCAVCPLWLVQHSRTVVCRHWLAPGMPLPWRKRSHWQGHARTQKTTVPWGWLPVAGALPLGEQSLHRGTETHLSILGTPCWVRGSCVGPEMKTLSKGEKPKSRVFFVCVTPQELSEHVLKRLN